MNKSYCSIISRPLFDDSRSDGGFFENMALRPGQPRELKPGRHDRTLRVQSGRVRVALEEPREEIVLNEGEAMPLPRRRRASLAMEL